MNLPGSWPRGVRPVVKMRSAGGGRVSIADVVCYRPGDRPRLFYQLLVHRRRKGFVWQNYRDPIITTHQQAAALLVRCWDDHNIRLVQVCRFRCAEHQMAPDPGPVPEIDSIVRAVCGPQQLSRFLRSDVAAAAAGACPDVPANAARQP